MHTEWEVTEEKDSYLIDCQKEYRCIISISKVWPNAEEVTKRIVQCNNNFDDLLDACKLLLKTLLDAGYDPEISEVENIARQAIENAEKGE